MIFGTCGNILYILGSVGYLIIDIVGIVNTTSVDTTIVFAIYVGLAGLFVVDAILYLLDWYYNNVFRRKDKTSRHIIQLLASIASLVGSIVYLAGAITKPKTAFTSTSANTLYSTSDLALSNLTAFILNVGGMALFLVEALLQLLNWGKYFKSSDAEKKVSEKKISEKKSCCCGCNCKSIELWAIILNILASIIYLIAHVAQPVVIVISGYTSLTVSQIANIAFTVIRPIQVVGDACYLADAILYTVVWLRDKLNKKNQVNIEPEQNVNQNAWSTAKKMNSTKDQMTSDYISDIVPPSTERRKQQNITEQQRGKMFSTPTKSDW
ncbi:unnamed protein product [Didymodactylos carnosus]|uniref:Transmembrane protein n=1 Tax=Didymodactylos carnosus TaxID=1234261 RepID=A0A815CGN5_9BILA|nr:unnamed protein product [Didymodactylos carnosus]CAF1498966.1 unnamed protein product [Didymodactylos carnosus]CAF4074709.1 unnamed protein product [Didymodactylos carnosus]CAF4287637.1 unnamed protein product [Didymodactylos carnosus]